MRKNDAHENCEKNDADKTGAKIDANKIADTKYWSRHEARIN